MSGELETRATSEALGEDEVARLLRLAGPPPTLDQAEVAAIRAAARDAWHRQLARRSARRRQIWAGGALAASLLVALGLAFRASERADPPGPPVARLELHAGALSVQSAAGTYELSDELGAGSVLVTGADGRAALRMANATSVRLDAGSRVRLVSSSALALESGALYLDTGPHTPSGAAAGRRSELAVATPLGEVTHLGTQFEVRLVPATGTTSEALRVRVREGEVRVATDREIHDVGAGSELRLSAAGELGRGAVAPHDEAWRWAIEAAPVPAIEGQTLASFLDWAAREMGVRWRVAGSLPAATPQAIVLHGSVSDLSPEAALEVVLTGSGLRSLRSGDELQISPAGR